MKLTALTLGIDVKLDKDVKLAIFGNNRLTNQYCENQNQDNTE